MDDALTPASDQLSEAVEPVEAVEGVAEHVTTPSERANEAWASVPGDSEASVDYADPDDATHTAKVVDLKGRPDNDPYPDNPESYVPGYLPGVGQGVLVAPPEIRVQTTIYFPDGGSVEVTEAMALEEEGDWVGEDVVVLIENVHGMLKHRF